MNQPAQNQAVVAKPPTAKPASAKAESAKSSGSIKLYKGLRVGSRAQVWHGTADVTAASRKGLRKADLTMNPRGHIVSKKQRDAGKKAFERLRELGFAPVKGRPFIAFGSKGANKPKPTRPRTPRPAASAAPAAAPAARSRRQRQRNSRQRKTRNQRK